MKTIHNIVAIITVFFVLMSCDTKKTESTDKKTENSINKEEKIIAQIKKDIKENLLKVLLTSQDLYLKNQNVSVLDTNNDGLLDGVSFLGIFNAEDNSFIKTIIVYYINDGKKMVYKDAVSSDSFVYPVKAISKGDTYDAYIECEEIIPNDFGVLNENEVQKSSLSVENDELSYGALVSEQNYDTNENYQVTEENLYKYVAAESGLIYRDGPDGKVLGKLPYATEVHITGRTGMKKTIYDDGKEIEGEWVAIIIDEDTMDKAFVFDGFLKNESDLDRRKLIKASPVVFEKHSVKSLILPGSYKIFNKKLKEESTIIIDDIAQVYMVNKTKYKRPLLPNDTYCKWANYVEVIVGREHVILFGDKVLSISSSKEIKQANGEIIHFVLAENQTVEASDEDGLTGCDDYSTAFIKSQNKYDFLYNAPEADSDKSFRKIFIHDEGMSEGVSEIEVEEDSIRFHVSQSFQEGSGSYKLKVFKENDTWFCVETDRKRE